MSKVSTTSEWGYYSKSNCLLSPTEWHLICPASKGNKQSPIDIQSEQVTKKSLESLPIQFHGKPTSFRLEISQTDYKWVNMTTAQENRDNLCKLTFDNQDYILIQFHMHIPSEHTIDNVTSNAEIHFVHKLVDEEKYIVIGVMLNEIEKSEENKWIQSIYDVSVSPDTDLIDIKNVYELFSDGKQFYNYSGSLTTPPCSEVVNWFILKEPRSISSQQLWMIQQKFSELEGTNEGKNARPIQPLNNRQVILYELQ